MRVRFLRKKDVPRAASIVGRNYSKVDARRATVELKAMFTPAPFRPVYVVAEEGKKMLGFAGYVQSWMHYGVYEVFWVNVLPEKQNRGIGKKLVSTLLREIKKKKDAGVVLLIASAPQGLSGYYKKHFGFKPVRGFNLKTYDLMALPLKKK